MRYVAFGSNLTYGARFMVRCLFHMLWVSALTGQAPNNPGDYSAAAAGATADSIRAAQNLNSGILPVGSSCGLVRKFAGASA